MGSVYERQKAALTVESNTDSVRGFANPDVICSKCGHEDTAGRKCPHCNEYLCRGCFYEKQHYNEFTQVYDLHKGDST